MQYKKIEEVTTVPTVYSVLIGARGQIPTIMYLGSDETIKILVEDFLFNCDEQMLQKATLLQDKSLI